MKLAEWRHIILFAKNHYGSWSTRKTIKKLEKLRKHLTGVDYDGIDYYSLMTILLDILYKYYSKNDYDRMIRDIFERQYLREDDVFDNSIDNIDGLIWFLLVKISSLKVIENTEDGKKEIMNLGEPSDKIKKLLEDSD